MQMNATITDPIPNEDNDLVFVKSRDTGASWIAIFTLFHGWRFYSNQAYLLVSRKEDLVDKPNNYSALMPKLDYILNRLPDWMRPNITRHNLHFFNRDNESIIVGESTTGNIARGERYQIIVPDEFAFVEVADGHKALAATQDACNSRWFISTPNGVGNAFYDVAHNPGKKRIEFSWEDIPFKAAGLYTAVHKKLKVLDESYEYKEDYNFILDGKTRSPWYDAWAKQAGNESIVAQEQDRDFLGSGRPFFSPAEVKRMIDEYAHEPLSVGEIEEVGGILKFVHTGSGLLDLWINPDLHGEIPADRGYVIAADISAGTGASNSCISVMDRKTNEKVAEYVTPNLVPHKFADVAMKIGRWFKDMYDQPAFMIWEPDGPGHTFTERVLEAGYGNVFYAKDVEKIGAKRSKTPGFYTRKDSKRTLLYEYARAIGSGDMVNRSKEALRECYEYKFLDNGTIGHVKSVSTMDPSGAKANHGDRVMADALCWHAGKSLGKVTILDTVIPTNCFESRRMKRNKVRKNERSQREGWLTV